MSTVTVKTKNVNSKLLFEDINKSLKEEISDPSMRWSDEVFRDAIVDIVDTLLEDRLQEMKITQFNVFSTEITKRKYTLTVRYRQKHCLNITEIVYLIEN